MSISYWLDSATSSSPSAKVYDFVIVGAGIAGLSTAYWLQKENPTARIAIIEKHRLGFGASGRNAGFVTCGSTEHFIKLNEQFGLQKATEIWKFSEDNRKLLLEHIIEDKADELDFRHTGSCTVAPSSEHWLKYRMTAKLMQSAGIDVHEIGPTDLEKDFGVTGFEGGIQYTGDGYIHPVKLLQRLRNKIKADIHEGTEVFSVKDKGTTQVLRTDHGDFEAPRVIFTLNAYLPLVLKNFESLIKPGRGQILVTEPLPAFVRGPCYLTKHLCYFRQLPTGHLLIGGFRNLAIDVENTYSDETTSLIQTALFDFVKSHFKYGKEAKIAYQWSGIMGFSPDGQMILGALPENKNIHIMAGCSGHGMGLSFNAAKTLVAGMHGTEIPSHLSISRF
ncbi:oxidoreductase [Bdellovibrio bacteriovorus]|uniref:Oxidoreductase n=1 Tax=Bdellovibrio bacteriovorus TaxID=959 RepID=A0A162GA01_BDEBC|nr:FAD-binding oxidoreductase [Bdellovibrio bacteriovorus]KYG65395.1 oxidoreductase [Bdellovibrio bacteriovorus]